jgi:kynurenine formamidase
MLAPIVAGRPRYDELPDGSAWGVFGADDALGCLNLLTARRLGAAAKLVRSGLLFSLNAPLDWPSPGFAGPTGTRQAPEHVVLEFARGRDDYLSNFYPQAGTQLDGFLHITEPSSGLSYNANAGADGIEHFAARGIAGRGVLLDLARWAQAEAEPIDWRAARAITVEELEACAAWEGVEIGEGTILLLRIGWQSGWQAASEHDREQVVEHEPPSCPGLEASQEMARRLWDWGVALVASDNPTIEVFPPGERFLHVDLLARLGIPLGEMWLLDALAAECAAQRRYELLVTCAPLHVRGGVGSTANALAIL